MKRLFIALLALFASTAFGTTLNPIQLLNPAGSTSGQGIISTGPSSAPAWSNIVATSLVAQAANTVVANATGSTAAPTAFAMPSCSTSASALTWTSGSGFLCNSAINASVLLGFNWAAPGAIGSTTPNSGTFTTLKASNSKVIATNTSAQSIPNGAYTQVTNWTASLNQGANFTASTGNYVAPAAGTYTITAALAFAPTTATLSANAQVAIGIYINGAQAYVTALPLVPTTLSFIASITGTFRILCATSDVVTIRVFQGTGAALALVSTGAQNFVSIEQEP